MGRCRWFVNSMGQTFVVVDGPVEFMMGSPPTEPDRSELEIRHRVVIPRRFVIAAKEVSKAQWQAFVKMWPNSVWKFDASSVTGDSPDTDGPMVDFNWYIAAQFCNWLSQSEGLPKDQWCYLPKNSVYGKGMTIPADVLQRKGYRIPTEAEWEYACRSGTMTSRYHGNSLDVLDGYARYDVNSKNHAWACGSLRPNDLGLFDMLGNMIEWVHERDRDQPYAAGETPNAIDDIHTEEDVLDSRRRLRGGAFNNPPGHVRSASNSWGFTVARFGQQGLRPCRTYP